jgi:hypothetical protein
MLQIKRLNTALNQELIVSVNSYYQVDREAFSLLIRYLETATLQIVSITIHQMLAINITVYIPSLILTANEQQNAVSIFRSNQILFW